MSEESAFLWGMLTTANAVAALFFFRFHRETRDRLFAAFAAAFLILAVQRVLLAIHVVPDPYEVVLYGMRLLAFLIILWAILDKNRRP